MLSAYCLIIYDMLCTLELSTCFTNIKQHFHAVQAIEAVKCFGK